MPNENQNNQDTVINTQNHTNPLVTSPYNFVPLNKEVFFPSWGEIVSHDVPFTDGHSGSIDIEIEAKSPIFIRGTKVNEGKSYANKDGEDISTEFMHYLDKDCKTRHYFIPGSSFRNMIRSVVETMSFGKMNFVNELDDFSFRDMSNPLLYNLRRDANKLKMGWLIKGEKEVYIKDAGNLGSLQYSNENTVNQNRLSPSLSTLKSIEEKYNVEISYNNFPKANSIQNSNSEKIIVLTGNIQGKNNEFLFTNPFLLEEDTHHPVSKAIMSHFCLAYENSESWKFWEGHFNNNKPVPVFFRFKGNQIVDFGLTVLYKMAFKKGILETLKINQKEVDDTRPDLAETIFGRTSDKNEKLKTRVTVAPAFSDNAKEANDEPEKLILGSPKPSFYPFYISQVTNNNWRLPNDKSFLTLNDDNAVLAGRKRYPIHFKPNPNAIKPVVNSNNSNNDNVVSQFIPLATGTIFKTKIHYHNLLPVELGALLSALTFHSPKEGDYFHNIGMAKPYGFGKIKVTLTEVKEHAKYIGLYEKCMTEFDGNWLKSVQLKELLAMAKADEKQNITKLKYPNLGDFKDIKTNKKALPLYSRFMNVTPTINPHLTSEISKEYKTIEKPVLQLENQEIAFNDIVLQETEIEFKIVSINPKKAQIHINQEKYECQYSVERGIDISKWQIGDIKNGLIIQISKLGKINQVKYFKDEN